MKTIRLKELVVRYFWTLAIALCKTCSFNTLYGTLNMCALVGFPVGLYSGVFFINWFMGVVLTLYICQTVFAIGTLLCKWEIETQKRQWKVIQARIGQGFFHSTSLYFPPGTPISAARSALRGQHGFVTHTAGF